MSLLAVEAAPTASIPLWGLSAGLRKLWPVVLWASEPNVAIWIQLGVAPLTFLTTNAYVPV